MENLLIVKIGGNVIDQEEQLEHFLQTLHDLPALKILVHGGGKLATHLAEKMDIPVVMTKGRRITDAETLKIATMVYAGYINKNITAQLQALGSNAIGLSGADGNSIQAIKRPVQDIDYGFVGDIETVNSNFFDLLLKEKMLPVVCAITHNRDGQLLNTNADTIASALATALSDKYRVHLIYCFEKKGVLRDVENAESLISRISETEYQELKSAQIIHEGMIPKMDNAFAAIRNGVRSVKIGNAGELAELTNENNHAGTSLYI